MELPSQTVTLPEEVERIIDARYNGQAEEVKERLRTAVAARRAEQLIEARLNGGSEMAKTALQQIVANQNSRHIEETEKLRRWNIRFSAVMIGADYLDATGKLPDEEALEALHFNGYGPDPAEIFDVYDSQEEYLTDIITKHIERTTEHEQKQKELLAQIETDLALGLVPQKLFAHYTRTKSEEAQKKNTDGNDIAIFDRKTISDDKKISRYARYQITCALITSSGLQRIVNLDQRRLDIALGVNTATNKLLNHAFVNEISGSNSDFKSGQQVKATPVYRQWEPYIYPDSATRYKKEIQAASKIPRPPEYYYDLETRRVLVVGRTAIKHFREAEGKKHIVFLSEIGRLALFGSKAKLEEASRSPCLSLNQLLIDKSIDVPPVGRDYRTFREWTKENYMDYGRWLQRVLSASGKTMTYDILRRAYRLGLGPGDEAIATQFDGLARFFQQLRFANTSRRNAFEHWTLEDHAANIRKIASEIKMRPTEEILYQRIKEGKDEPSPYVIENSYGFSAVFEAAGFPEYNKTYSVESCVEAGAAFFRQHGRVPNYLDLDNSQSLPSLSPIYRLFENGIPEYQAAVLEFLETDSNASLAA